LNRRIATAMTIAVALIAPAAAKATPMNDSYTVNVASASHDLGSYHVGGSHDFGFAFAFWDLDVTSRVNWTGNLPVVTSWNSANVREGASLPVGRMSPMLQSGALHVTWTAKGDAHGSTMWKDIDKTVTVDASCVPVLMGSDHECTATAPSIYLMRQSGMPGGPYIKLKLQAKFTVTPEGAIVSRTLTTTGLDPVTKSGLALSPVPATDTVAVPCGAPGSPVGYKLGPLHWTPAVSVKQQPILTMGILDPVIGQAELPAFYDKPYGPVVNANPKFDLTGSAHTSALGTALPNNIAPTIAPMSFSATAGVPKRLDADVSARCDVASYVWKFSDGTTAYGAEPTKTFSKSVTGQLKVTDSSGLSATRDFSVSVS
jgi:PKD domain-containing protein